MTVRNAVCDEPRKVLEPLNPSRFRELGTPRTPGPDRTVAAVLLPLTFASQSDPEELINFVQEGRHQHPLVLPVRLPHRDRELPQPCDSACYSCNKLALQDIV